MKKILLLSLMTCLLVSMISIYMIIESKSGSNDTDKEYALLNPKLLKLYHINAKQEEEKDRPDKPDEAMKYEFDLRSETGKPFSYKGSWRMKAYKEARRLRAAKLAAGMVWAERGPGNIGGRSRSIVVHPDHPDTWWVGAVGGGVWKTTNAGESWTCQTDDLPVISITTIDICKSEPDILYAGTGEGFSNYAAVWGDGIFKTLNGGQSWQQLSGTAENTDFRFVNRIIVNPDNPDIVLAVTNQGLYRSINGGDNWTTIFEDSGRVQQIIANPENFNTQFLTINRRGIYKSVDMGIHWHRVTKDIFNFQRIEMAVSPVDTSYIYATFENGGDLKGFYKSIDGGKNWVQTGFDPNWLGGQGWYDNTLCADPYNRDFVIVGGIDLLRINTAGNTMNATALSNWYGGLGLPYVHADQHFIVTIKGTDNNYSIIAANDGGIFFSPDKGLNWENKNHGYNVTQYYDADRHPYRNQFIAGAQDNGTDLSPQNTIFSDYWTDVLGGDGFDCAWDKENPNVLYASVYYSRIYKSINGGGSFTVLNDTNFPESSIFHTPLELNPYNSQKIFTATDINKIFHSSDAGDTWRIVSLDLGAQNRVKIRISKADTSIVWAASKSQFINVSTNGGISFTKIERPEGTPDAYLAGLETNPSDSASALITFGVSGFGKIFRTENMGSSWEDLTNNLPDIPVHCALIMPYNTNEIWIGTDIGVFISKNNGQSWAYIDNGLPAVSVRRLKIVNQEIVAVTHGRGVWSMHNELLPQIVIPLQTPILNDLAYPDPNLNQLKVSFMARGNYDSILVRLNGETVQTLTHFPVYEDTFTTIPVQAPDELNIELIGIKNDNRYKSDLKTINYYKSVDTVFESFDSTVTAFSGDLLISQESGFNSPTLHTNHFYNDQREYISVLQTPLKMFDDSKLSYRDVAIVEPGEPGHFYPDAQMWDYVTVEGSRNGYDWDILIEPYDCRLDSLWQTAYTNKSPGNSGMFLEHEFDLTGVYSPDEFIYIRFRLHADEAENGWGWAIDDVRITSPHSASIGHNPEVPDEFNLIGNYPNPFNPGTAIRFTLEQNGPVQLDIFNNLGQRVRTLLNNKVISNGTIHEVYWDGRTASGIKAASGTYYYRLISNGRSKVKKMILLR